MPNARAAFATLVPISPQSKTDKVREETDIFTPERHPSTRTRFWTLDPRADAAEIPFPTDDASDAPTQRMGGPRHPREPGQSEGRRRRERDARGRRSGPLPRACYFGTIYRSDGNAYDASVRVRAAWPRWQVRISGFLRPLSEIAMDSFRSKEGSEADGASLATYTEGLILRFLKREIWVVIVAEIGRCLVY